MSDELILDLETLTPIWTGDAFRKGDEIKSSGIMGSVRWWYETINRGLGRKVCNSTSVFSSCKLNGEEFIKSILKGKLVDDVLNEQEICPACKLFGCNDWSGKFRLIVEEYNDKGIDKFISIANRRNNYKRKVEGKLFTKEKPLRLHFQAIKEMSYEERELLKFTLNLIGEWAALGARTAQGNGVVWSFI